jgi:putative peptidoglycan lipid II flippase
MNSKEGSNQSIGRSMLQISALTFGSRIFGLVRDIVMAAYWGGTGAAQAAFQVAFAFPNSLRALFGEGAFTSAFVPMLSARMKDDKREEAWQLAERAISVQALALLIFVLLISGLSVAVVLFAQETLSTHARLTFLILPILMPYALFICMAGAFSSVLNCLGDFKLPAATPILFNILQIATVVYLSFLWANTEFIALLIFCASALLAGLLQLLVLMLWARRRGFVFHFRPVWKAPEVQQLCQKILPGLLGAGVMQINSLVDRLLALHLGPAAVGALNYSQHLVYLPVGIFGVAMSVVCLPIMSRATARADNAEIANSLDYALRMILFLSLPCATLLFALQEQTVMLLFARGAFTAEAVRETCWALSFYILGLPAFCCAKVATNPFHARLDTTTPVKVAIFCMVLNLVLNLILMQFLRQGGLALSTSICSWLNVILLLRLNRRHLPQWSPMTLLRDGLLLLKLALLAALGATVTVKVLQRPGLLPPAASPLVHNAILLLLPAIIGGLIYLFGGLLIRRPELHEFRQIIQRR